MSGAERDADYEECLRHLRKVVLGLGGLDAVVEAREFLERIEARADAEREPQNLVVGRRLRAVRERLGVSVEELAARIHAEPDWLQGVEAGAHDLSLRLLGRLASALGVGFDLTFVVPRREYRDLRAPGEERDR